MPITLKTEQEWFDTTLGFFRALFTPTQPGQPVPDFSDKSLFGLAARAFAQLAVELGDAQRQIDNESPPAYMADADGTLRSRSSSQALDDWAVVFGLPSEIAGKLGRRGATRSSGGSGIPSTTLPAIIIALGATLVDGTGTVTVETTAAITTSGPPNTIPVFLRSVTAGVAANLPVGSVLTWTSPPAGVGATLTLTAALQGGKEREGDSELLARILDRLQNPPRGGTAADYRFWSLAATDADGLSLAIQFADVFPLRSGGGTVDIVPLLNGEGTARIPPTSTIADLAAYIELLRPVTATVNILTALMPANKALRIRVHVEPHPKYPFDWGVPSATFQTAIQMPGSTTTTLLCGAPTVLKDAVAAGKQPRVQVILSGPGAPVRPFQTRVTNIVSGIPDTVTVETPLPVAPVSGDYFWPGGPVVDPVADAIATFITKLRSSRQSGYADPFDVWDYKVTQGQIARLVLDAKDADGTRLVATIPSLGTNGVQIAVGSGAFASVDYEPRDVLGAPEVAYLAGTGIEVFP